MIVPVVGLVGKAVRELKLSVRPCARRLEGIGNHEASFPGENRDLQSFDRPPGRTRRISMGPTESDRRLALEKYHKVARK
jgi:hypothetical protein